MTDNFHDLVEASFGSMMNVAGRAISSKLKDAGKEALNRFLVDLSSARAAGRLDLGLVLTDVRNTWKYYTSQQQLPPTVASMVDFLQTVFGMQMDAATVEQTIFGPSTSVAPQMTSPNSAVMVAKFKAITRKNATDDQIKLAAGDLARMAKSDSADENFIVQMLKWIGGKFPNFLNRPSMAILAPWMHGGKLTDQQIESLLTTVAKALLKRQMIQKLETENGSTGQPVNSTSSTDETKPAGNSTASQSDQGKPELDPTSSQEMPNWGGLIRPTTAKPMETEEVVMKKLSQLGLKQASLEAWFKNQSDAETWEKIARMFEAVPFQRTNSLSANFMPLVVRTSSVQDFTASVQQIMTKNGSYWPKNNYTAAYQFIRAGGDPNEVTAELNHFADNPKKASVLLVFMIELAAKEWQRRQNGEGPDASQESNSGA